MRTPAAASRDGGWLGGIDRQSKAHPLAVDVLLALAVAAVLGSLTASGLQGVRMAGSWLAAAGAAFVVLHLSVALRRSTPEVAFVLASLAMLAVVLVPDARATAAATGRAVFVPVLFMPSSLVFLLILYTAAGQPRGRGVRVLALLAAVAGAVLAAVRAGAAAQQVFPGGWVATAYLAAGLVITVLATWILGSFQLVRRQRTETERTEAARLAVLEERTRIARDMHDVVAHSLAVIVRQAEGGAFVVARAPGQAEQALRVIADTGREALGDMRGMVGVLRGDGTGTAAGRGPGASAGGPYTTADGPTGGPQPSLADLPALLERMRETGLDVVSERRSAPFPVGAARELAAYRVVQEALTNTVKHAGPHARAQILLDWSADGLAVQVTDDAEAGDGGAGVLPVPGAGAGLRGLQERVSAAGGLFSSGPHGTGFRVRAVFPRRHADEARAAGAARQPGAAE